MRRSPIYRSFKAFSWLVLLLMLAALTYSVATSIRYWSGIGV